MIRDAFFVKNPTKETGPNEKGFPRKDAGIGPSHSDRLSARRHHDTK